MDTVTSTILNLVLVFILVLLNGFFVAAEFALVKVRTTRIAQIMTKRGKMAQTVLKNLDAYLSATQLGITLASLGLGWIGEPTLAKILEPFFHYFHLPVWLNHTISFVIAFSVITFLHIVLGEMAPKSLAIRRSETTTLWTVTPLHWFYIVFKPFIIALNSSANFVLKWLGIELQDDHQQVHTEEEIRMVIKESHKSGIIDKAELTLFDNVFEFTDRVVREIMVPRIKIIGLDIRDSSEKHLETILHTKLTRFPIYDGNKDQILGVVLLRDFFETIVKEKRNIPIQSLMRPIHFIPETIEIKDAFMQMQKAKSHMAIVVDEYGGISGLVTIEDIIEEIFGEIQDEFDNERPFFQDTEKGVSIEARLLIEDVNKYFHLQIDDDENDTIGGWLFSQFERIPSVGEELVWRNTTFIIEKVNKQSIERILVKKTEEKNIK
ncbi:hemolysin family protein [Shimazuella sp. AN120528]|uniref:hemolysin family protein n=1 Tax=Shimazuella soli TaxID=1892854 RepID=UPI001F0E668A|nr:hemolysin family protein [Shimazuella soli]MCH5586653.1 hemolysin family protein [Shimazuella soli]